MLTDAPAPMLLSIRDTARALAVCEKTLWSLARTGKLRPVRIGRAVRYDIFDVRAFIERAKKGDP